ncbi:universal stress protein [Microbacterium sp. B2969]|uniref:Universal stress protein n=1 Tax=Microbacterium alkaliflavum TaxID=3248839 RepID=A0ABW7Q5P9_9MICO
MERIVIGFDGSPGAESALDWVTDRAHRHPVLIDLVGVANMFASDRTGALERLEDAEARMRSRLPGTAVESHLVDGTMPGTLVHAARSADLLVIGIDREHLVRTAVKGWMPLRVAVRSHLPTCLVPGGWSAADGPVFVGVDEDSSDAALLFAAAEAAEATSTLRIVHAWSEEHPVRSGSLVVMTAPRTRADHERLMRRATEKARETHQGLTVESDLIHEDDAANLLRSLTTGGSLVVLGTHGRGLLSGAMAGSVAQKVLWDLRAPVCVVPDENRSSAA